MRHLRLISIFVAAFVLGTGLILTSLHQMGLFIVKGIPVEIIGSQAAQQKDVPGPQGLQERVRRSLAGYKSKKIWDIRLREVKAAIIQDEWVKDVLISRSFPNSISVRIIPKQTALVLVGAKGELWPITEDGNRLETLPADALPDVPLLRGEIFQKNLSKRKEAIEFALTLPATGAINQRNVSEIFWNKDDGYSLMLLEPKVEVKLGNDQLSTKVLRVGQVMNYLSTHQLKGRVIDASFSKKVLVRLRKGS